jgi:hypothetical protein
MMQAAPSTAEPITVNLTPPDVKVAAGGEPVEIVANIRNAGTTVDQYSLEVENLDPSWYTVGAQSVSLFPGDSAPIPIRIHPPKGSTTRAGHYTFVVRARSHADPTLVGVTKGVVQVGSYSIFQAELAPKRVTGRRGKFNLSLANGGNNEIQLDLSGRDPEAALTFGFKSSAPSVAPGSRLVVPVVVHPKGMRLAGESRRYPFVIHIRPTDGEDKDAREVAGEVVHKPRFRSWGKPFFVGLLTFLLLIFLAPAGLSGINWGLLPQPFGGWIIQARFWEQWFHPVISKIPLPQTTAVPGSPTAVPIYAPGSGFEQVHTAFPTLIGDPLQNEWNDAAGNAHQRTSTGDLSYIRGTNDFYFSGKGPDGKGKLYSYTIRQGQLVETTPK